MLCCLIRKSQKPIWPDRSKGYLIIFFDYEGDYAKQSNERAEACCYGVKRILEICKKHEIKTTFNTVGKLFYDYPEIIERIIDDGHDIASHSFKHDDICSLNRAGIDKDIQLTREAFKKFGLVLRGMRSPQNRWSFKQMHVMLKNGLNWSAEGDQSKYPYYICKNGGKKLIRFPITFGDHNFYISKKFTADEMYEKLIETTNHIQDTKIFGAIGFHPWVNGEDETRLHAMEDFFQYVKKTPGVQIITFNDAYNMIVKHNK